jgi:hypothetical protein
MLVLLHKNFVVKNALKSGLPAKQMIEECHRHQIRLVFAGQAENSHDTKNPSDSSDGFFVGKVCVERVEFMDCLYTAEFGGRPCAWQTT